MQLSKIQSIVLLTFGMLCQYTFSQEIPYCQKGTWGFAATDGTIIIPCVYDEVDFFSDDSLAKVKKAGKYGYINKKGVVAVPFEYDEILTFVFMKCIMVNILLVLKGIPGFT